jgi:hypothetical protein
LFKRIVEIQRSEEENNYQQSAADATTNHSGYGI